MGGTSCDMACRAAEDDAIGTSTVVEAENKPSMKFSALCAFCFANAAFLAFSASRALASLRANSSLRACRSAESLSVDADAVAIEDGRVGGESDGGTEDEISCDSRRRFVVIVDGALDGGVGNSAPILINEVSLRFETER